MNECVHHISDPWDPILIVLREILLIVDQHEQVWYVLLTQLNLTADFDIVDFLVDKLNNSCDELCVPSTIV